MTTTQKVMDIFASKGFGDSATTPNSHFEDECGGDSLDKIELGMEIETVFGVKLDDHRFDALHTPQEMADYVDELVKEAEGQS